MKRKVTQRWSVAACMLVAIAGAGCRSMDTRNASGGVGTGVDYVDATVPHRAMVWRIENVEAMLDRANPSRIIARVRGETTSTGWLNPEFVPFVYNEPPRDGIYEFVLTGERPGGIVLPRTTAFHAELVWRNPPPDVKGIRIHAVENRKEDRL